MKDWLYIPLDGSCKTVGITVQEGQEPGFVVQESGIRSWIFLFQGKNRGAMAGDTAWRTALWKVERSGSTLAGGLSIAVIGRRKWSGIPRLLGGKYRPKSRCGKPALDLDNTVSGSEFRNRLSKRDT
jgi:hypothetical protein